MAAGYDAISSTEMLVIGDSEWVLAGPLPQARWGVRAVSLQNSILLTGGRDRVNDDYNYYDAIMKLTFGTQNWVNIGRLGQGRYYHAMTTVPAGFC